MTDLALRPRSSTELVDASFQVFRRTPVQFIVAAALVYVPWLVIQLVFDLEIQSDQLPDFDVLGINLLAGVVVYVILGGVIALLARDAYFDQPPDVARAFRTVQSQFLLSPRPTQMGITKTLRDRTPSSCRAVSLRGGIGAFLSEKTLHDLGIF